jgi:hypothetical protein
MSFASRTLASDRITLDLHCHRDTTGEHGAWLLSRDADSEASWVPKSLCTKVADGKFKIERFKATQCGFLVVSSTKQGRLF